MTTRYVTGRPLPLQAPTGIRQDQAGDAWLR